jgi:transcriptional regulator with XRE-family HTH domain
MTARKTDAERGPLGAWAFNTRELLDMTAEAVAAIVSVHPGTVRKIEGGSNRTPSAHLLRSLHQVYMREGEAQRIAVAPPPGMRAEEQTAPEPADLADAIRAQTRAIELQTAVLEKVLLALSGGQIPPGLAARAAEAQQFGAAADEAEGARTGSPLPLSDLPEGAGQQ